MARFGCEMMEDVVEGEELHSDRREAHRLNFEMALAVEEEEELGRLLATAEQRTTKDQQNSALEATEEQAADRWSDSTAASSRILWQPPAALGRRYPEA